MLCWLRLWRRWCHRALTGLHRQGNATAREINRLHRDRHLLPNLHDVIRVFHKPVSELTHMDQAVLMYADVDKGAKCNDVCHDTLQHHSRRQMFRLGDVVAERRRYETLARVAAGLPQLTHNVVQRRQADIGRDVRRRVERRQDGVVPNQLLQRDAKVLGHACHQPVAFGMHRAGIERMRSTSDA